MIIPVYNNNVHVQAHDIYNFTYLVGDATFTIGDSTYISTIKNGGLTIGHEGIEMKNLQKYADQDSLVMVTPNDTLIWAVRRAPIAKDTIWYTENFEGTGYDSDDMTWAEFGSPEADEDYTSTVLRGSQSLYIADGNGSARTSWAEADSVFFHFSIQWDADAASDNSIMRMNDSNGDYVFLMRTQADSTIETYHGPVGGHTESDSAFIQDSTYHFWGEWKRGSGSNGVSKIWVTEGTTRSSFIDTIFCSTGTATNKVTDIRFLNTAVGNQNLIFDQIEISNYAIKTVDE